jgi:hypothetical protein
MSSIVSSNYRSSPAPEKKVVTQGRPVEADTVQQLIAKISSSPPGPPYTRSLPATMRSSSMLPSRTPPRARRHRVHLRQRHCFVDASSFRAVGDDMVMCVGVCIEQGLRVSVQPLGRALAGAYADMPGPFESKRRHAILKRGAQGHAQG